MLVTAVEVQEATEQTSATTISSDGNALSKSPASLKRKRGDHESVAVALKDIHIRPYPGSIYDKPHLLKPLRAVSRSRLPLTFLDTSTASDLLSSSRLFTSYIDVLEHGISHQDGPQILIASLNDGQDLYAIERVKSQVYSLCKLCSWVQIGYIEDGSKASLALLSGISSNNHNGVWWSGAARQRKSQSNEPKRIKLSMTAEAETVQPPEELVASIPIGPATVIGKSVTETSAGDLNVAPIVDETRMNEEIFETLIRQYLEAVYVSKTSLAFFAKGPLSRTRNAFTLENSVAGLGDLTAQLRSMLLSMTQMDKKYREKLPETIKGFPAHTLSEDELDGPVATKKRRSKKVPKLSREGYYTIEDDYCKRWWSSNQSANARARPDETFEQLQKRRTGDLRRRETLAQITIILEILALESLPEFKASAPGEADSQSRESQVQEAETQDTTKNEFAVPKKPKRKQKKQQDLSLLLDLLLDKLSIWQSIEQDLGLVDADKKRDTVAENNEKLQEQDILVGFCTDVVIPFYKSRVPVHASLINKKLGGPGAVSPDKARPKEAAKNAPRPGDRRSRNPLQKTLSDSNGFVRSRPPSLSRSATDTQGISLFKREASELSLFDIPLAKPSHRDSSSQLRHLKSRQVDLTAISTATETRIKKQAKIEQDLKEAIGNIARPNRNQAVRELADAADKRSLGSASMRKKTMAPVKKVLQNVRNVQVTATPKHRRGFNALTAQKPEREPEVQEQHAPSSGDFCVPSSGVRTTNADVVGATPAVSRTMQAPAIPFNVAATPSRRASRLAMDDHEADELHATPARDQLPSARSVPGLSLSSTTSKSSFGDFLRSQMSRKPAASTPLKASSRNMLLDSTPVGSFPVFATPAKPNIASSPPVLAGAVENTPVKSTAAQSMAVVAGNGGQSIYDALGWNDYDDE